jgi:hypothetical protein
LDKAKKATEDKRKEFLEYLVWIQRETKMSELDVLLRLLELESLGTKRSQSRWARDKNCKVILDCYLDLKELKSQFRAVTRKEAIRRHELDQAEYEMSLFQ